jgi:hypothetical protein
MTVLCVPGTIQQGQGSLSSSWVSTNHNITLIESGRRWIDQIATFLARILHPALGQAEQRIRARASQRLVAYGAGPHVVVHSISAFVRPSLLPGRLANASIGNLHDSTN